MTFTMAAVGTASPCFFPQPASANRTMMNISGTDSAVFFMENLEKIFWSTGQQDFVPMVSLHPPYSFFRLPGYQTYSLSQDHLNVSNIDNSVRSRSSVHERRHICLSQIRSRRRYDPRGYAQRP
jgi:hypothetical protein